MRTTLLLPLLCLLPACTGVVASGQPTPGGSGGAASLADAGGPSPGAGGAPAAQPGGWSIRDGVPYARIGHTAVLDEENDRMIVFGGGANDTWQLPLSGPNANQWSQVVAEGQLPPVHAYGGTLFADSAVYDPIGKRMIVLLVPTPSTEKPDPDVHLWALSLDGTPTWQPLVTAGPSPGAEVQSGHLAFDRANDRLFVAGGALAQSGLWSLSLGGTPTWSRVADLPADYQMGGFLSDSSLAFDASRGQVLLFGGHERLGALYGFSLATSAWQMLDPGQLASQSYGVATVLDAANDQLVLFGGDQSSGVAFFSLATHAWTSIDLGYGASVGASGVLDPTRGRALFFGGQTASAAAVNATWSLDLATETVSELTPGTRTADYEMGADGAVWDPTRGAVVAFGSYEAGATRLHGLASTDAWAPLEVGTTPTISFTTGIYDPVGKALVVFGGYDYTEQSGVERLASTPGAGWESLAVADGPVARSQHVAVYDAAHRRLVIHGGWHNSSYSPTDFLDDAWALSLDGAPAWTPIEPAGPGPIARRGHVGVYDPAGERLVIYGGFTENDPLTDLWSLSLGDAPAWSSIAATGTSPGAMTQPSAVYDAARHRMIVLDLATTGARVFALDLGGAPAWHEFCWTGITPADTWDSPGSAPNAVLVDDGLFVSVSGGAFRFDLGTPYCG